MIKNRLVFWSRALLAVICLLGFPGTVLAQGHTWAGTSLAQMVEAARWRAGALRFNASLNLTNVGYDTDIYYGYLSEPVPDFTLRAYVPVQLLLPLGKKVVLELNDSPEYLFFLETSRQRAWSNTFRGRIHFGLERFYIQAGGGISNISQRMSPELDVNVREKSDSFDGTILWQASESFSLAALYGYARYDYGEAEFGAISLSETQNREERFVDLITYVQPSSKIRLSLDGQYGEYRFTDPASAARATRSYSIFGALAFVPQERGNAPIEPPQGNIAIGYERFDILDAAYTDGSAFVGTIDVSVGLFKKTTARAFLSRDFAFSIYSDGSFYLSTALGGGIGRLLSRKATLTYDLAFGQGTYPEDEAAGSSSDRNFSSMSHAFGLSVRLGRHLGVTFQATLESRSLGDGGTRIRRNFFGFSLVYGVPSGSISAPMRIGNSPGARFSN